MLRHVAFRVKDERHLALIGHRLADGVIVHVEVDLRAGLDQFAGAIGVDVAILANRIFVERAAATGVPSSYTRLVTA